MGGVDGRTKSPTSALVKILSLSTYGWKDKPSHPQVPWLEFLVFLPAGGVDGRTKSPTSVLVKILSLLTYGWKDEPSHLQVPWSKF